MNDSEYWRDRAQTESDRADRLQDDLDVEHEAHVEARGELAAALKQLTSEREQRQTRTQTLAKMAAEYQTAASEARSDLTEAIRKLAIEREAHQATARQLREVTAALADARTVIADLQTRLDAAYPSVYDAMLAYAINHAGDPATVTTTTMEDACR